ncbi:ATP-dependent DNA ligase [Paenibacillus terrigena]|uniref:ATP-dependent DNA ligase n=1 Tax=Paenibacillus terrigena TaxID=369333 RepID=UPI0028D2DFAE|nr:ATP-dependent DNA ligase [Paenibacillus terrigena]
MFISPMLLETAEAPFSDENYIFEPKIDGHRGLLLHTDGTTRLYTRHNNDCTRQYPELSAGTFDGDVILDGEIACTDPETGVIDFESVMTRFQASRSDKIRRLSETIPANFVVFDILRYKGEDLRNRPLMERKEVLDGLALPSANFGKIPFVDGDGEALFSQICARKLEGTVAKRKDSVYESRRSNSWLKLINWTYVNVYITGYRKGDFGWLAGVETKDGRVRPAGIIELGVTPTQKMAFYGVCQQIVTGEDAEYVYVQPRIKARVKIRNWTKAGMLRTPAFVEFIV